MGLFSKVKNIFREAASNAEAALADTARDGKFAIEDSKKEIAKLTTNIAELKSQTNIMVRERKEAADKVETLVRLASKALTAGNEADARQALSEKQTEEIRIKGLDGQISQNNTLFDKLIKQRDDLNNKVSRAQANLASLTVRHQAAKIRTNIATQSIGADTNSALAALDKLESDVNSAEAEADAYEEVADLNDGTIDNLEEKYGYASTSSVDDELAKLKSSLVPAN